MDSNRFGMLNRLRECNDNRKIILGFGLVTGFIMLSMLQDLVHSYVRNYNFYISESLVYNTFWLLFPPFIFLQIITFNRIRSAFRSLNIIINLIIVGFLIMLHLISFPLLVVALSELFFEHTYRFQNVMNYGLSENLYIYMSVYLTVGVFLIFKPLRKGTIVENDLKTLKFLIVQKGTERIIVATDSIYCITAEAPYVAIHTLDKKYLYSDTLTSLTSKLDKSQFVRIHKSTIIHSGKMSSYVSRKNGDYDVMLENGLRKRMSRTYTSGFKSRIQ